MATRPIPRRTSDIELWDIVPVGTRTAWQREMLQFWALMMTRGRRLRTPAYLMVQNPDTGRQQPRSVRQLALLLAGRVAADAEHISAPIVSAVEEWLADSLIVPGERAKGVIGFPAAGLSIPHFIGLGLFSKGATRERYWATTFYLWLAADMAHSDVTGEVGVAAQLAQFLHDGLDLDLGADGRSGEPLRWSVNSPRMTRKDPEVMLATRALSSDLNDGLPSFRHGLSRDFFAGARPVLDPTKDRFTILCPGAVVLMRRGTRLLLDRSETVGHGAMAHLLETGLAHAAAQYYVRGMRVLNDLVRMRRLPDDCSRCWARFADDIAPVPVTAGREVRWQQGEYHGSGGAGEAAFVEANCESPFSMFLNAGTKEDASAKDLARISLESLRQQLSEYTVNRLWLSVAWSIADELAAEVPGATRPTSVADVLPRLDEIYANPAADLLVASRWKAKIKTLITDKDVPGSVVDEVLDVIDAASGGPAQLEDLARMVIAESILSARYFGRYVELLNSIVGGGALPSNQDPKGMMARGGRTKLPFHLSVNDSLLEYLVAVASLEAEAAGHPLSFSDFLDQLSERYLLDIDRAPAHLPAGSGLAAEAISESRAALRGRLSAMGFLEEFSDSSTWNRVKWVR